MNKPPIEIVFAPGCFDDFEGTQEELDELIQHIQALADSGELLDEADELDLSELDNETREALAFYEDNVQTRTVH